MSIAPPRAWREASDDDGGHHRRGVVGGTGGAGAIDIQAADAIDISSDTAGVTFTGAIQSGADTTITGVRLRFADAPRTTIQCRHAHRGAGMQAGVAQDLAEELGGTVDNGWLAGERRVRGNEADHLHDVFHRHLASTQQASRHRRALTQQVLVRRHDVDVLELVEPQL